MTLCLHMEEGGTPVWKDINADDRSTLYELLKCDCIDIKLWWIGDNRFAFIFDDSGRLKRRECTVCGPNAEDLIVGDCLVLGFIPAAPDDFEYRDLDQGEIALLNRNLALDMVTEHCLLTNVTMRRYDP